MLCENCKERPATVVFKQETSNGVTERHLCDKCAFYSQTFSFSPDQEPLSIQQFLAHWLGGSELFSEQKADERLPDGPKCPNCDLTFHRFLDIGKFGCAECYETFRGSYHECLRNCIMDILSTVEKSLFHLMNDLL